MTEENKTALDTAVAEENTTVEAIVDTVTSDDKYKDKSVDDLIKMHQNAEKLIGKKAPTAPEQYVLPEEFNLASKDALLGKAKELNITQDQMKEIADVLIEDGRSSTSQSKALADKAIVDRQAELESIFGEAFEDRKKEFEELSTKYAGEDMTEKLKELSAFENPVFMKFFDKINTAVLKHTTVGSDYVERKQSPAEADAKIKSLYLDKEFMAAYYDKRAEGHNEAVAKMSGLHQVAHQ